MSKNSSIWQFKKERISRLGFAHTTEECRKLCRDAKQRMVTHKDLVSRKSMLETRPQKIFKFLIIETIFLRLVMILKGFVTWFNQDRKQQE